MTERQTPPFRADHVGSFLRPSYLLQAREQYAKSVISAEQLRAVEDKAIAEIVKFQADVGLPSITDGEFRRTYFHIDFLEQLGGVKTDIPVTVKKPDGTEELAPPVIRVIDKVRHAKQIQLADFQYLKSQVDRLGVKGLTPKVTIPSPTMLPRRPRRHQQRGLPRTRSHVLRRRGQGLWGRAALAVRGWLHLRADGRHQHGLPVRREDARGGPPAR
jgi:5-methyltetrahydropteroyltriglutamate--homocysteine methyltransferase